MALSSYKHANNKLDEQLFKLKTAKTEMNRLFEDIDKLIDSDEDDTQNYSYTNYKRESFDNDQYDQIRCKDVDPYEKFEPNIFYSSDEERSCSCKSEYRLSDELSDANEYYYAEKPSLKPSAKIRYVYRSNDVDQNRTSTDFNIGDFDLEQLIRSAENIESIQHSNMLTNDEKMQYTYLLENMKTHDSHYKKYESSRYKNNRKDSLSPKKKSTNSKLLSSKTRTIQPPKPTWQSNGKIKNTNNIYRSSSSINKNNSNPMYRSTSSINKISNPEQKSSGPLWRPSANVRPKSALYYSSSQDLKKTEHLSRKISQSKDIGNGWRPISRLENDYHIYYSDTKSNEIKEQRNKKPEINDIGKGWKPNGRLKTEHKIVYTSDARTDDKKDKKNTENKDVGSGWKAVGKLKEENFFKTDPTYVRVASTTGPECPKDNKAKSLDVGQGWKPSLKVVKKNIKFGMSYSKPPVPNNHKNEPKKENVVSNKVWAPSAKLKSVYPNTWLPEKDKQKKEKPISSKLSKLTKYKQRINMLTSTPNISQRENERTHLNESGINNNVEPIQKSSSRVNSILEKSINDKEEAEHHHLSRHESLNQKSRVNDVEKTLSDASNKLNNELDDLSNHKSSDHENDEEFEQNDDEEEYHNNEEEELKNSTNEIHSQNSDKPADDNLEQAESTHIEEHPTEDLNVSKDQVEENLQDEKSLHNEEKEDSIINDKEKTKDEQISKETSIQNEEKEGSIIKDEKLTENSIKEDKKPDEADKKNDDVDDDDDSEEDVQLWQMKMDSDSD